MIKGRDIIVHGLQGLDSPIGSNCINLAYEFAKNNRVLYVNYPIDRITSLFQASKPLIKKRKRILAGKQPDLIKVNDNMWNLFPKTILESISKIGFRPLFSYLNKINNKRYAREIKKAIDKLGFKDCIIFNDSDFYRAYYFKELLKPAFTVYYTRDNMRETAFFKKNGAYFEDRLMEKSDLVVSNSMYLNDIAKANNPNSVYVGQGCDVSLFNREIIAKVPDDIESIPSPIIGYIGALKSSRLDIEVLEHIALSNPKWNIVLVGSEDNAFARSNLHNIENVHFLGSKKELELPQYLNAFDIALNPQALNKLTIGNYPRKIDEYLAMGKPVVATLTKTMEVFAKYTYLAKNKEEYVILIAKALEDDSEEKSIPRITFARTHTWENNANAIYEAINNTDTEKIMEIKEKIKSSPKLTKFAFWMLSPKNQARPRLWIKLFVNPFKHKRGKGSLIRRRVRMDVMPFNNFVLGRNSTIEDFSTINNGVGDVLIGDRSRIGMGNTIIGPITIGNNVMFAQNIVASGLNHGYKDLSLPISRQPFTTGHIIVEDETWIGANSVLTAGVKIGKHSVVAAGCVVVKDVPPYSVVGGNPARILKQYNNETKTWERPAKKE